MKTKNKISLILLGGILILACFFRFGQIWFLPGGLYSDEAANGLDALNIAKGEDINVFYERNYGREGLYFYFLALSIKIFGVGVWQLKIVSGVISILTIIGLYLLVKELANKNTALLACLFAAVSLPFTILSRVAFRAILIPCVLVFFFYFAIRALRREKKQYLNTFLAGIFLGLGFYTYISFRIIPFFILLLLILGEIVIRRTQGSPGLIWPQRKKILVALIALVITTMPLALYFIQNPDSFLGRASDVSILNPNLPHGPLYYLGKNIGKTLIMFNIYGDANWRHNIAEHPFFDPASGILFLIGLVVSIYLFFKSGYWVLRKKDRSLKKEFLFSTLILGWVVFMLIPMITSEEGVPHFLRSIGIMPIVFIFPALGLRALCLKIRYRPVILAFLLLLIFVLVVDYNLWMYFKIAKNDSGYYRSYYGDLTAVSRYISRKNDPDNTFLVLDSKADRTTRFLTSDQNNPYNLIAPEKASQYTFPKNSQIIFPSLSFHQLEEFKKINPQMQLSHEEYNRFGEKIMEVYSF